MNISEIKEFLALLGCENINHSEGSEWVRASCPLAPFLHKKGTDNNPSFGVRASDDKERGPAFHCFTCETSGSLEKLLFLLTYFSGNWNKEASKYLSDKDFSSQEAEGIVSRKRYIMKDRFASMKLDDIVETAPVPDSVLQRYPLVINGYYSVGYRILEWLLNERKLTRSAVEKQKLRIYNEGGDIGVVFPILNRDGTQVLDLYVRLIPEKRFFRLSPEVTRSPINYKASHLCFGNHLIDPKKPVILVEGAIDCLRLNSLGQWNVLATMGSMSKVQVDFLYTRSVCVAFDADEAGREKAKKAIHLLTQKLAFVYWVDWSKVGVKDPGELVSVDQFREAMKNAVPCITKWQEKKKFLKKGKKSGKL